MLSKSKVVAVAVATLSGSPTIAGETVTYSYDALGRVTTVSHSGSVNNGVTANYTHDAADNRTNVTITGSPYNTVSRFVPVPLGATLLFVGPS